MSQLDMPAVYAAGGVGDALPMQPAEAQLAGLGLAGTPSMQHLFTLLKTCASLDAGPVLLCVPAASCCSAAMACMSMKPAQEVD